MRGIQPVPGRELALRAEAQGLEGPELCVGLRVTSTGVVVSTPGEDEITQDICCREEEP